MNKNPNSLTRLTEFEPHSDDIKPTGNFFYRLFKRSGSTAQLRDKDPFVPVFRDVTVDDDNDGDNANQDDSSAEAESMCKTSSSSAAADSSVPPPVPSIQLLPERTVSSVLKRLSRIVVGSSGQSLQAYKDSDFKQYWMPDSNCHQCYECGLRFSTLKRRHHCRICGQIFCHSCCSQQVPGKIIGYTGYLRACTYCCKVVLQYIRRPSSRDELHESVDDVEQGTDDLTSSVSPTTEAARLESPSRSMSVGSSLNSLQRRSSKSLRPCSIFDEDAKQRPCSDVIADDLQVENSAMLQDPSRLNDLWQSMYCTGDGVHLRSHRHRLYTYTDCMIGRDIVDWLISNNKASTREQALMLGQALIDGKWMIAIAGHDTRFRDDNTVYRPFELLRSSQSAVSLRDEPAELTSLPQVSDDDDDDGPLWVKEIPQDDKDDDISHVRGEMPHSPSSNEPALNNPSVFYLDTSVFVGSLQPPQKEPTSAAVGCSTKQEPHHMNRSSSSGIQCSVEVGLMPALQRAVTAEVNVSEMSTEAAVRGRLESFSEMDENNEQAIREKFSKLHIDHLSTLVKQLLNSRGLPAAAADWTDMLLSISRKISQTVRPDIRNDADDMDIRQYVIIKTVPGGVPVDTAIINGLVCTKSVAHRKMQQDIVNPRILLLRSSVEYQRVENKFSSLEPQILQEHEYLRNCVGRIATLQPDILLVEKTVSRLAQRFLLDANITLILNVKPSVMERVARFTQATIVPSIDGLVKQTTMGSCQHFYMRTHQLPNGTTKSLMYFDGCAKNLGCTVTLRGSLMISELRAMKNILRFMTYAMYNARLENAFLFDELAAPPDTASLTTVMSTNSLASICDSECDLVPLPGKVTSRLTSNVDSQNGKIGSSSQLVDCGDGSCCVVDANGPCNMQPNSGLVQGTVSSDSASYVSASGRETVEPVQSCEQVTNESAGSCNVPISGLESDDVIHQREAVFQTALSHTLLTVSPCSQVHLPYLETEAGARCRLRRHFPAEIYWSCLLSPPPTTKSDTTTPPSDTDSITAAGAVTVDGVTGLPSVVDLLPVHPFIVEKLTAPSSSPAVQSLLSDYRARGGRLPLPTSKSAIQRKEDEKAKEAKMQNSDAMSPAPGDGRCRLPDCLDALNHQRFLVLFSSFSHESANAPLPCVAPWVVSMEYYGRNDVTLGGFLERYCFREQYRCSSRMCDTPMTQHIRRFVHGTGCLQVVMRKLDIPMAGTADTIYTWTYCRKCRDSSQSQVSALSTDAWSLSFAKYLELRFHASSYVRRSTTTAFDESDVFCCHSLHHDHHQYFGCQSVVASFRYSTITLKEVAFPGIVIPILPLDVTLQQLEDDGKMLRYQTDAVFMAVLDQLHRLKKEVLLEVQSAAITDCVVEVEDEQDCVTQKVEYMLLSIRDMKKISTNDTHVCLHIQDAFVRIKRQVAELVIVWNDRIHDFEVQIKKSADRSRSTSQAGGTATTTSRPIQITGSQSHLSADDESDFSVISDSVVEDADASRKDEEPPVSPPLHLPTPAAAAGGLQLSESIESSLRSRGSAAVFTEQATCPVDNVTTTYGNDIVKPAVKSKIPSDVKRPAKPPSREAAESEKKERTTSVKQMFSSFLSGMGSSTVQVPFPADEHHLLPACQKVPVVVYDQEPSSVIAYALSSQDYEISLQQLRAHISADVTGSTQKSSTRTSVSASSSALPHTVPGANTGEPSGRKSVLSFLKGGTSSRDSSPSHHGRPQKYEVDVVKYTPHSAERDSIEDSDEVNDGGPATTDGQKSLSKSARQQPVNHHIELQFSDNTAKFYCRVCFADQFIKLRKLIFPDGEERYIRSLSRCFTWLARGGKSGSSFCKTQDDRFILKQMSRYEVQSFNEFAPHYFEYITNAHAHNKPTALAKIVGVYKIGYQNSKTGAAMKQDLLVMENLFYNRNVTQIFDLKGSARNRLVSTLGKRVEDLVLMDENLLKASVNSPLYVFPHSKAVLTSAITRDTQFLAKEWVMDYSLLVGCDDTTNELVVGIIDYIRTFTWDKMLEMVFKKNIIGAMPTVVSPELYRRRFLESMDRYFLYVPDRWTGHGRGIVT